MLTNRISMQDWQKHSMSHPMIGGTGRAPEYVEHPVCPRCEKIALRGNGRKGSWGKDRIATCPACGYQGPTTMVMKEYIQEELYRR